MTSTTSLTVLIYTLKRMLKNKIQLLLLILLPLLSMYIPYMAGVDHPTRVGWIDLDNTTFTQGLQNGLASQALIKPLTRDDAQQALIDRRVDYALVIEKGFTDRLIRGEDPKVQGLSVQETNISAPIKAYVDSYLDNATRLADAAHHDPQAFEKGMESYRNSFLTLQFHLHGAHQVELTRGVLGMIVLFMMYSSAFAAMTILTDKQKKTLPRTLTAPISMRSYMAQTLLGFFLIACLQVTVLLLIAKFGFHLYLGSFWSAYVLLLVFALVAVSFGVVLSSITKTITQACIIGASIIIPLAFLGGVYWPIEQNPEVMQKIARFEPVTWVMTGLDKVLRDSPFTAIGGEIGILALFATMFFLFGTLRKVDVQK